MSEDKAVYEVVDKADNVPTEEIEKRLKSKMEELEAKANELRKEPFAWADLSADQKLERMRKVIKDQSRSISNLQERCWRLERLIEKHRHSEDGLVVLPISEINRGIDGIAEKLAEIPGREWF